MADSKTDSVSPTPTTSAVPTGAYAYPGEQILILHGVANGTVRNDGKGINATTDLVTLEGVPSGRETLNATTSASTLAELMTPPPMLSVSLSDQSPIPEIQPTVLKKASWTFPDGSTISATGKGVSNAWNLAAGGSATADVSALVITGGTGRYAGARGTVTTQGVVYTPAGQKSPYNNPGGPLTGQHSVTVFKFSLGSDVA